MSLAIFWFRRDLRLEDNAALYQALKRAEGQGSWVQPLFIFDREILAALKNSEDKRLPFLHETVCGLKEQMKALGVDLWVVHGQPEDVFAQILSEHQIGAVFCNHDYEPSAIDRDKKIHNLCRRRGVDFHSEKDQVIFEKNEVLTEAQKPYTVYTPYKRKWLASVDSFYLKSYPVDLYLQRLWRSKKFTPIPELSELGFQPQASDFYPPLRVERSLLKKYAKERDYPARNGTSKLGLHLRFGTVSIRELAREAKKVSEVWLSELIWREFFMQILFHFPQVEKSSFRPQYEKVPWRSNAKEFQRWCEGETGYPLVDAGMRELNATGFMHNRVRMVVASFLTKHLLMHWYEGERYFARHLLDYDLAANNGNWQWAAGTGCDAAPYFRIFNPQSQMEKFDPTGEYVKHWVPEWGTSDYLQPMVDHKMARERALRAFAQALKGEKS